MKEMTVMVEGKIKRSKKETWRKRIGLEKCFIVYKTTAIIIGLSALLALIYVVYNKNLQPIYFQVENTFPQESSEKPKYVCNSAECIHTASRVLKYMDKNTDPCENFYDFACGGFVENTNKPDTSLIDSFILLKYFNSEQIINIIEEPIKNDEPHPFHLVKKIYSACMDEERIEKEGLRTMKNILRNLGEWPVLQGNLWVEDDFNWKECDYSLKKLGYHSYFLDFDVFQNHKNSTNMIVLDMPELLNDEPDNQNYFKYMVDVAEIFGADRKTAESELKESFDLEIELTNFPDNVSNYKKHMTIAQLEIQFPSISWMKYINNLLAPDSQVTKDEIIMVLSPDYIAHFETVISRTPKRIQANYVMWRVVADSVEFLTDVLRKRQSEYITATEGEYEQSRREECLSKSNERLGIASSAMYVSKYFNVKAKQTAIQMVSDIRSEFYEILKNVDWMDEKTRRYALEKAVAMKSEIGYPEELIDKAILEEYYKDLELDTADYLLSILKIDAFRTRLSYQKLRQRFDKTNWKHHSNAKSSDAYYALSSNKIKLPAGSLQGIFFDVDRPAYMNYASIGFVISQSITYGFNKIGSVYNKNGTRVDSWWQNHTKSAFIEKAQCFIDQYREYYSAQGQNLEVDDMLTQNEVMADNGGIKIAYLAYNKWSERNGLEPKLPGLNYTPQQMFWISAANTLCSKYRPNVGTLKDITANFRVFDALSNSEHFAKDFNCPVRSPMNSSKTCQLW